MVSSGYLFLTHPLYKKGYRVELWVEAWFCLLIIIISYKFISKCKI